MSATELAFKPFTRQQMAQHAAADIPEGWYVNLGIGIPTMIADHVPTGPRGHLPLRERRAWAWGRRRRRTRSSPG